MYIDTLTIMTGGYRLDSMKQSLNAKKPPVSMMDTGGLIAKYIFIR